MTKHKSWFRLPFPTAIALCLGIMVCGEVSANWFKFEAELADGCGLDCMAALGTTMSGRWYFDNAAVANETPSWTAYESERLTYTTSMGVENSGESGTISVANDVEGKDAYTVGGFDTLGGDTPATLSLTHLSLQMIDEDGTVFSDEQLPTSAPDLSQFESAWLFATYSDDGLETWRTVWKVTGLSDFKSWLLRLVAVAIAIAALGWWWWRQRTLNQAAMHR